MSWSYWCIALAALVPYLFVLYAKWNGDYFRGGGNKRPREYTAALTGRRQRAYWAHLNSFEVFPPFAAGVIIASIAGASPVIVNCLATAFVALRILYGVFYVTDKDRLRSLVWSAGMVCVVGLFAAGAW
ncbi:MAG: hypothetical protein RJA70_2865 [Pseudomonadota bacterium]|jgi:uncharacterized MAPEG superfamily protein